VTAQGEGGPGRRRDLAVQAVTDKLYVSPALETVSWANESGYPAYLYVHRTRVGKKSRVLPLYPTLQRKSHLCFLYWELHGLSPNFHIHVSVSDLYIPRIDPHIFLQQNRQIDRGNI
jgi:hypothetical protein